jgi:hypothetical protein
VTDTDHEMYGVFITGRFGVFMWRGNNSTNPDNPRVLKHRIVSI